jgi:hypothetical protein
MSIIAIVNELVKPCAKSPVAWPWGRLNAVNVQSTEMVELMQHLASQILYISSTMRYHTLRHFNGPKSRLDLRFVVGS